MARNTVYVIGAGASFEAGLPIGNTLKDEIAKVLRMEFSRFSFRDGNHELYQAIRSHVKNNNSEVGDYAEACCHIVNNMPLAISIDNFIDTEKDNDKLALCGKIGIVDAILKAERKSKLYFTRQDLSQTINFSVLENTWYLAFFRTLTENCGSLDLEGRFSGITLVIFNYDRCIEHFLYHALKSYYRLGNAEAAKIVGYLTIIHPYGTVGSLSWQDNMGSDFLDYGSEIRSNQLFNFAQRIRTFTEGAHSEFMDTMKQNLRDTERIIFLGFAFHSLNMKLLSLSEIGQYGNQSIIDCYATAYQVSKSDQESIRSVITHLYKGELNINIENMTCDQLFKNYSRSLGYA